MNQFKADCIDEKQILIRILSIRFTSFVQGRERFLVFTATGLTLLINLTLSIVWNNNRITAKQSQNLVSLCYNNPQELDLVYYHIFNDKSGVGNLEWRTTMSFLVIWTGMLFVGIELVLYMWIARFLFKHDRSGDTLRWMAFEFLAIIVINIIKIRMHIYSFRQSSGN